MKYIAIFMAFLTIYFIFIPCSDDASKSAIYAGGKIMGHSDDANHQDDHHDRCTPFCSCSCCAPGIALFFSTNYQVEAPIRYSSKNTPLSDQKGISQFNHSIWQPPKI